MVARRPRGGGAEERGGRPEGAGEVGEPEAMEDDLELHALPRLRLGLRLLSFPAGVVEEKVPGVRC